MKKKKENKKCSFCEMRKKMMKKKGMKESFYREEPIEKYVKELSFAKAKPFKVSFNEGMSVSWKNKELSEKKLSVPEKEEKEKLVLKMKKGMTARYGHKKGTKIAYATATKTAKKKA
jgi:hypothetical protein